MASVVTTSVGIHMLVMSIHCCYNDGPVIVITTAVMGIAAG